MSLILNSVTNFPANIVNVPVTNNKTVKPKDHSVFLMEEKQRRPSAFVGANHQTNQV